MITQPKFIQINISNACNSRCPGCPITLSTRNTELSMSPTHFSMAIDAIGDYVGDNPLHLQFGIGNTLQNINSLLKYIDVISSNSMARSRHITLEFSVTFLLATDSKLVDLLMAHISKVLPGAFIIVECIISPTISSTDFSILELNVAHVKHLGIDLHIICRFTNGLNIVGNDFINMIRGSNVISLLTIDFFFKDRAIGSKYTYDDFENWSFPRK